MTYWVFFTCAQVPLQFKGDNWNEILIKLNKIRRSSGEVEWMIKVKE